MPAVQRELRDAAGRRERAQADEALREAHARLQALSHRILKIQEAERQRISRELHDDVAQMLTVELMQLHMAVNQTRSANTKKQLAVGIGTVEQAIDQIRAICMHLRPPQLDELGLLDALRAHLERQEEVFGLQIHFHADALLARLHADVEITCFRLVQEAVTNIGHHAKGRNAWIELSIADSEVHLTIRDDGTGFDIAEARERAVRDGRIGLIGMQERAALAGGRLEIDSTPGRGTEVRAVLPLHPVRAVMQ